MDSSPKCARGVPAAAARALSETVVSCALGTSKARVGFAAASWFRARGGPQLAADGSVGVLEGARSAWRDATTGQSR